MSIPGSANPRPTGPAQPSGRTVALAAAVDLAAVLLFVILGRRSHSSGGGLMAATQTALPFLAGLTIGWLLAQAWRAPLRPAPTGLIVWLAAVIGGLAIRYLWTGGYPISFALVTATVLGVLLVGWRLLVTPRRHARPPGR